GGGGGRGGEGWRGVSGPAPGGGGGGGGRGGDWGPTTPADTPSIVWQPTQALFAKIALPSAPAPVGSGGAAFWPAIHASNSAAGCTSTRMPMLACEAPQNSAHCPQCSPAASGVSTSQS